MTPVAIAFCVGLVYITLCYRVTQLLNAPPMFQVGLGLVFIGPAITLLSTLHNGKIRRVITALGIGVLAGVMLDAVLDRSMDRNLFPIEFLWWITLLTPGLFVGAIGAFALKRVKARRNSTPDRQP